MACVCVVAFAPPTRQAVREAWAEEDDQENQYRSTPEIQRAIVGRGTSMTTGRGTGSQTRARLSSRRGSVGAALGGGLDGAARRGSKLTGSADFMGEHLARRRSSISHAGDLSAMGRTAAQAQDLASQIASGRAGKGSGITPGRRRSSISDVQANAAALAAAASAAHAAGKANNKANAKPDRPSMQRARSTTIKLSGTDSAALSAQIQAQAAAANKGGGTKKPSLRTQRSTTIKLDGSSAEQLSATLRAQDEARRRKEEGGEFQYDVITRSYFPVSQINDG